MRKLIASLLLLVACCYGQITLSTNSVSATIRQQFVGSPYPTAITVSGTGTIGVGTISSSNGNVQSSLHAAICQTTGTSQCIATTTAPATIQVWTAGYGFNALSPGTYSGTIQITSTTGCTGGCNITYSLTVVGYSGPTFVYPRGTPLNCVNTGTFFYDPDTCTIPSTTQGTFTLPAPGSGYTDGNFGGVVTTVTSPSVQGTRTMLTDAVVPAWNADKSLIANGTINGTSNFSSPSGSGDVWTAVPTGNPVGNFCFDQNKPKRYYYLTGLTVHQVDLVTPPSTWTDSVIYTYSGSATSISNGGDGQCSKDNFMAFYTLGGADNVLGILNLATATAVTRNIASDLPAGYTKRAVSVSPGINATDSNRYVVLLNTNTTFSNMVYTFNGSTISFAYAMPQTPEAQRNTGSSQTFGVTCDSNAGSHNANCYGGVHAAMVEVNNIEYWVADYGISQPTFAGLEIYRLDTGSNMAIAAEAGGGGYYPNPNSAIAELHVGCAIAAPYCVVSSDTPDPNNVPVAYKVTAVTTGANPTITTSPAYGGANGDIVSFGGVLGVTGLNNAQCTVAGLSGTTFTAQGCTTSGTYTSGTGAVIKAAAAELQPHANELYVIDLSNIANKTFTIRRIATSRDNYINGGYLDNNYFGQAHASISFDGTQIAWQSNNYLPDQYQILTAPTGFGAIAVTNPTINQSLSGFSGFSLTSTLTSLPSATRVCYVVDSHSAGCVAAAPYSLPWNTFNVLNGTHSVYANAFSANGALLATSPSVPFTVANTWPVTYAPGMTVATGTPLYQNWSGSVSVTPTFTGTGATNSKNVYWYVDSVQQNATLATTSASPSFSIDTTQFSNGPHVLVVSATDNVSGTNYSCFGGTNNSYVGGMGEWSVVANFSNGATPMEMLAGAREVFIAPTATFQLSPSLLNTDGTTTATTPVYYSQNTSVATVSNTGLVTGVAQGNAQIRIMAPTISGTDLVCVGPCANGQVSSASHPFTAADTGRVLNITSANGWTAGKYEISNVSISNGVASLTSCSGGTCANATPGVGNTGSGTYTRGPSRSSWAFVNSTAAIYHFGTDGSILSAYNPVKSFYVNSSFQSMSAVTADQPYSPGFLADYSSLKFNTLETGLGNPPAFSAVQNTWQTAQTAAVASTLAAISPYSFNFILHGDSWMSTSSALYSTTRGPSASWSPAALTYAFNSWIGSGTIAVEMQDEVNSSWDHKPRQGPLNFGSGPTSIVAASSVCTLNWPDWSTNGARQFVISGSVTSGMNSTTGNTYAQGNLATNSFTFPCSGVANGTYNSSNDAALLIEPYVAQWFNSSTGGTSSPNDYIRWDAFKNMRTWITSANSGRPNAGWPNAAGTTNESIANWENPSNGQADYATIYYAPLGQQYLQSYGSPFASITAEGDSTRAKYGAFSPNAPMLLLSGSVVTNHGFQNNTTCTVSSFSGSTLTCSAAHGVQMVLPGVSRLWLTGMSNSADNGNYYITAAPTPTTLTLVRATTSFTGSGTGGTITFSGGATKSLSSITASGQNNCTGTGGVGSVCGDAFTYTGSYDSAVARNAGQTFTISGNSNSNFNSGTFSFGADNMNPAPNSVTNLNFYRQVPNGSSTSGTATIMPDNLFVLGRNGSTGGNLNAAASYSSIMYGLILRAAGQRMYTTGNYAQGFVANAGFTGLLTTSFNTLFQDACNQTNQLYAHPHWDDGTSRPLYRAAGTATIIASGLSKYLLQTSLNSPDYGRTMEWAARTGSYGNLLIGMNFADNQRAVTVNLSPYLETGQKIVRLYSTYANIQTTILAAGTTTDTVTLDPLGTVIYLFPVTASSEYAQPTVAYNLSDVVGASSVVLNYAYDPYWLANAPNSVACPGGICQMAVDLSLTPLSYQLVYLGPNGNVVARSDVQSL